MTAPSIEGAIHTGEGNPALLDTATGALSRAAFTLRLEEAIALAVRLRYPVSAVVIDLVDAELLRERRGPEAIDLALAAAVDRVWGVARRSDTLARVGPARLVQLLPATDGDAALAYAARLKPVLEPDAHAPRYALASISTDGDEQPDSARLLDTIDGWRASGG